MQLTRRVRTPTVIQMEAVECGAASLSMILGYYKHFASLEELRIACGVSKDGASASNILKAAKSYGLDAQGFKLSIEDLAEAPMPCILFWNFNHFVVLEGFSRKGVWLNDPSYGPKRVSYEEFSRSYTGLTLVFSLTDQFVQKGSPPSGWKVLISRLQGIYSPFLYLGISQFCLIIPVLTTAAFLRIFIDKIVMNHHWKWIWGIVVAQAIILGLRLFLTWLQGKCLYRLNAFLAIRLSSKFLRHLLRMPIDYYHQRTSGDLAWRVQLNDTVVNVITEKLSRAVLNLSQVVIYAGVMFAFSWVIALIAVSTALCNAILLFWINRTRQDAMSKVVQGYLMMTGFAVGGLQNMETIKSLGMENDFFSKWAGLNTRWLLSNQKFGVRNIILTTLTPFFHLVATASLIGVGAYLILQGQLSIGMLMALHVIMQYFLSPVNELMGLGKMIQEVKINLLRLDDTSKNPLEKTFKEEETPPKDVLKLEGNLEFKDVSFGYNPSQPPTFKNISLSLSPGKSIAVVGSSGSGKSTLSALACSLYIPFEGKVLYDGKERSDIAPIVFHNSVSVVNQQIQLITGSVKDNLTLLNPTIPDDVIVKAAEDALIHKEILSRKGGYDREIMEGGHDLSGGERQRMEIARALVKNPSILVLDEATSALDAMTEALIVRNVKRRGCSCFIVAHRLSTIRDCDEIIVLDKGQISQRGTHESLMQEQGLYQRLVQFGMD